MKIDRFNHYLRRLGFSFQIQTIPDYLIRRQKLISSIGIDCIIDVGANRGQFVQEMRNIDYTGKIYSFEPLSEPFKQMQISLKSDRNWLGFNYALGASEGVFDINVSNNTVSSSLLPMLDSHKKADPNIVYTHKEKITVKKLDEIFPEIADKAKHNYLLKIDTQGYESDVIDGGHQSLNHIDSLLIEMSFAPLYDGEKTFLELCQKLEQLGYSIYSIEPGFQNHQTGRQLQVDVFLHRCR